MAHDPLLPVGGDAPAPLSAEEKALETAAPVGPSFCLHHGDAVTWLRSLPSASVDLVITDPPYESLEKHRAIGTTTRLKHSKGSSNDWFSIFPNARFEELFAEIWRVLRRHTHFYLFCDAETMFVAKPIAEKVGFRFWKPLVWDKKKIGMGYHYRSRYEFILFFEKGKRKLSNLGTPDVLEAPRIVNGYPTEKPPEVSRILVQQSTVPGERVLDPFMGAGSVGVASVGLGRRFLGNDISTSAIETARQRLLDAGGRELEGAEREPDQRAAPKRSRKRSPAALIQTIANSAEEPARIPNDLQIALNC